MGNFNPYTDLKFDPGTFGSGSSSSGNFTGIGTDADTWGKAFNTKIDYSAFGPNKDKDKEESPWGDVARFAGTKLADLAKNQSGQSGKADGLTVGGGGGVAQSGDLTIVYPQAPTVMAGQKGGLGSALGSIAGAALGSFIPGIGTSLGAGIGGSIGGAFG